MDEESGLVEHDQWNKGTKKPCKQRASAGLVVYPLYKYNHPTVLESTLATSNTNGWIDWHGVRTTALGAHSSSTMIATLARTFRSKV